MEKKMMWASCSRQYSTEKTRKELLIVLHGQPFGIVIVIHTCLSHLRDWGFKYPMWFGGVKYRIIQEQMILFLRIVMYYSNLKKKKKRNSTTCESFPVMNLAGLIRKCRAVSQSQIFFLYWIQAGRGEVKQQYH